MSQTPTGADGVVVVPAPAALTAHSEGLKARAAALEADAPLTVVVKITMSPQQVADYADDFDIPVADVAADVAEHAFERVADAFVGSYWVRQFAMFTVSTPA